MFLSSLETFEMPMPNCKFYMQTRGTLPLEICYITCHKDPSNAGISLDIPHRRHAVAYTRTTETKPNVFYYNIDYTVDYTRWIFSRVKRDDQNCGLLNFTPCVSCFVHFLLLASVQEKWYIGSFGLIKKGKYYSTNNLAVHHTRVPLALIVKFRLVYFSIVSLLSQSDIASL